MQSRRRDHAIWWGVWFICLLPLAFMGFWLATGQLAADPCRGRHPLSRRVGKYASCSLASS